MEITLDLLKKTFYYKEGYLYWKTHKNKKMLFKKVGCINGKGYVVTKLNGRLFYVHRLIFFLKKGQIIEKVDHIDGNKQNNLITNLREATNSQNSANRVPAYGKYKGVYKDPNYESWRTGITVDGVKIHCGSFKTEIEAALEYNKYAVMYFKEFANLNIITP